MNALRWIALAAGMIPAVGLSGRSAYPQAAMPDEYQVRAAIIANLTRFVTWPQSRNVNPRAPFIVGLLGYDEQGAALEKYLATHTIDGRPAQVRRLGRGDRADDCYVLYVSSSERKRFDEIALQLAAAGVLTVSDGERFAMSGGIVGLPVVGDRIEIQINLIQAQRSSITISSRLLSLARVIRQDGSK